MVILKDESDVLSTKPGLPRRVEIQRSSPLNLQNSAVGLIE
jgi:hypothetical protein